MAILTIVAMGHKLTTSPVMLQQRSTELVKDAQLLFFYYIILRSAEAHPSG